MGAQKGLSLGGLFIVLGLVTLLAALVIPWLLNSRIVAGEESAIVNLALINRAQTAYAQMYPSIGYAAHLSDLGSPKHGCSGAPTPAQACLLFFDLSRANVHELNGYVLDIFPGDGAATPHRSYVAVATPAHYGKSGHRTFCMTEDHVIRGRDPGSAPALRSVTADVCRAYPPLP